MNVKLSDSTKELKIFIESLQGVSGVKVYTENDLANTNARDMSPALRRLLIRHQNQRRQSLPGRG